MKNDLRAYGRIPSLKHMTGIMHLDNNPEEPITIQIKDLSPGGVLCESKTEIQPGSIVNMEIQFPSMTSDEPGKVMGKIVRCNRNDRSKRFEIAIAYIRKK
jgi:hypothetical protein